MRVAARSACGVQPSGFVIDRRTGHCCRLGKILKALGRGPDLYLDNN